MNWELDEQTFAAWAPPGVIWSEWAKPVAFLNTHEARGDAGVEASELRLPPALDSSSAVVVDLPAEESIRVGLMLAERGWCPVPLFNGTSGPSAVIDMLAARRALVNGAEMLKRRSIAANAPPAFLLDSRRRGVSITLAPGMYDNRWVTLPQDFPSGALLASRDVRAATVLQRGTLTIQPDLAHVLRRWQEQGLSLRVVDVTSGQIAEGVTIPKPSGFKLVWYAAIALLGLRRSNVGGFGSAIPEHTSGGYG